MPFSPYSPDRPCGPARRRLAGHLGVVLIVFTALALSACEEGVNPIMDADRYYSLYGFLNMNRDTQYVRVDEVRPTLRTTDRGPLDGRVTSTDLMTGEVIVWRDSVYTFDDSTLAHIFWAPFRVIPSHRYRIEVERSDGAVTSVETTVPPRPVAVVRPPQFRVGNQATIATQTVVWQNVEMEPDSTAMWYRFFRGGGSPFFDIALAPARATMTDEGWEVLVNLTVDRDSIVNRTGSLGTLLGTGMRIIVRDAAWDPPGTVFDPRVLSQPGVFSNVENGFGFVGASGVFSVEWMLDATTASHLGFPMPGKRAAEPPPIGD